MLAGSGAPRRVRLAGEQRMPISGTLFMLEDGLIGMVLDAGAHEALARAGRGAVRAAARGDARRLRARARGGLPGRRRGGGAAAARALGGDDPLRGRLRADRRALGRRTTPAGSRSAPSVPLTDSDGLTAIVARTGAPARIEDYRGVRGHAAELMVATRLPLRGRRAGRGPGGRIWGLVLVASAGALGRGRRAPAGGLRGAGRAGARERGGARGAQRLARAHPRGGRDRAPAAGAQPARRRAAAARRARRPAAGAREAPRRARRARSRCCAARRRSSSRRSPSCASSPAGCIPPCSPTAASRRRWRRSLRARRCR